MLMPEGTSQAAWQTVALLIARLIFAGVFAMAATFKFLGMEATASYIASAGFPLALPLAWLAAGLETLLVICFLTGAYFSEAALVAAIYVLFLGVTFHGPSHWAANQAEFGFFVDHFTFIAGLLFAAVHGPGEVLAINRRFFQRS
jgi:putative oxidoreductase